MNKPIVLVNFGGPRTENEIRSFLTELLCDHDVIRTSLPTPFQNLLFKRIAAKRSLTIREEYEKMGGASIKAQKPFEISFLKNLTLLSLPFIDIYLTPMQKVLRQSMIFEPMKSPSFPFFHNLVTQQPAASHAYLLKGSIQKQCKNCAGSPATTIMTPTFSVLQIT